MTETLLLGLRVTLSLALVLALLWFLARRVGARTAPSRRVPITVLGRQTLGRRSGVVVVEVGGRTLLLGVSETGVRLLSEVDPPEEADDVGPVTGTEPAQLTGAPASGFDAVLAARTAAHDVGPPPPPPGARTLVPAGPHTDAPSWASVADLGSHRETRRQQAPARLQQPTARHRGRRRAAPGAGTGPLAGSVLAPSTWSRTWAVLQERSGR